jgi:hypothetical protein
MECQMPNANMDVRPVRAFSCRLVADSKISKFRIDPPLPSSCSLTLGYGVGNSDPHN